MKTKPNKRKDRTVTVLTKTTPLRQAIRDACRKRRKVLGGGLLTAGLLGVSPGVQAFPASLNLGDLDGTNGFVITDISNGAILSRWVDGTGDVNDDGIDDIIIGANLAEPDDNRNNSGVSYVIFGGADVGGTGSLAPLALDGTDGFAANGAIANEGSGYSVSGAGDVNGDGLNDLLIGAPEIYAAPFDGKVYVVFGDPEPASSGTLELADLDGNNGFVLNGVDTGAYAGMSVSGVGDLNGDGTDDLLIGAPYASPSGASYVVFGAPDVGTGGIVELADLDGTNGFVINGIADGDNIGRTVSGAGDVNNDGADDLLISEHDATPNGIRNAGVSYVVFGGPDVGTSGTVELADLDGSNGFAIHGGAENSFSGYSLSGAGDINGDDIDDLLIGEASPSSYVVFGAPDVGSSGAIELADLNGTDGFAMTRAAEGDRSASTVGGAGDVNGDGMNDIIIGAGYADLNGDYSGASYVVFGRAGLGSSGALDLEGLDGVTGFVAVGADENDHVGLSVGGAGDVNNDGVDDLIMGGGGEAFVLFGESDTAGSDLRTLYLSTRTSVQVNGIRARDEDILALDLTTGTWSLVFDGSMVGLSGRGVDLNAFEVMTDGSLLLSVTNPATLPDIGAIEPTDIVRFTPMAPGDYSAGTYSWFFDGSDVGLAGANIDALSFTPDGELLISALNPGPFGRDEDLLVFEAVTLGEDTTGSLSLYFDGSDVGLRRNVEDVQGAWVDEVTGEFYLTTQGAFEVSGAEGVGSDVFVCAPDTVGTDTTCTFSVFFEGEADGLVGGGTVDGLSLGR